MDISNYSRIGQAFAAANVSAKSVIAVTTAMTGLILLNPFGSGKIAVVASVNFVWTTVPAAMHQIGIAVQNVGSAGLSSLTAIGSGVQSADGLATRGASVCQAYDAATFATAPVAIRWCGAALYSSAVAQQAYSIRDDVDGAISLRPGTALALTTVTTTAVGMGSISWFEVNV